MERIYLHSYTGMQYEIIGTIVPAVRCILNPGEAMYTQSGGMMMYTGDISYSTGLKGGIAKSAARQIFTKESAFMTTYYAKDSKGIVVFSTTIPGTIQCLKLEEGSSMICQKTAFLCAESNIFTNVVFTKKIRAGLFGGEGFVLQKIHGTGRAFLEIAGDVIIHDLEDGEVLYCNSGNVVAFQDSVDFDITLVKTMSTFLFGGEGNFLVKLTGPGKVILQTQHQVNSQHQVKIYSNEKE